MLNRLIIIIGMVFFLIVGCYPVSHIIIGDKRVPINSSDVGIYAEFPSKYEKIAIIEAGSDFSFKDPSFDFTHQKKTDKALERLKNEAALLGANGIVIQSLSTQIKQNLHATDDGIASTNEKIKEIKAIAIFIE